MFTTNLNGDIIKTNRDCEKLLGYNELELLSMDNPIDVFDQFYLKNNFYEFAHLFVKDENGLLNPFRPLIREGYQNIRLKMLTKEGESIPILFSTSRVKSTHGFEGFVSVARDISQEEDLVKELELSKLQLTKTLENSKLASWVYDVETNNVKLADGASKILGMDATMFNFSSFKSSCSEEDWNNAKLRFFELGIGKPLNLDLKVNIGSEFRFLNIVGYPFVFHEGSPVKFAGTFQDITDRKIQEENLIMARKQLEGAMKTKDMFLANMSHEIRTPLNSIIGFTRLLEAKLTKPELIEYVQTINQSSRNLLYLINEILDLNKLEAGAVDLEAIAFSLSEILKHSEIMFEEQLVAKKIGFSITIEENVPKFLVGDPFRLNQIITNLLSNAIKFTSHGGVSLNVTVSKIKNSRAHLAFRVKDTGVGIADESVASVFDQYKQAGKSTTRRFGGTGLGLAIVKHLVNLFGGTISVESILGQGSTFTIELSLEISTTSPISEQESLSLQNSERLKNVRILAAEDNPVNQLLLKEIFNDLECDLTVVENGLQVLDTLDEHRFDIILMDLQMPEMNGYDATAAIRQSKSYYQDIPIIALSADALTGEKVKCQEVGMNDYISKPFDVNDLIRRIVHYTRLFKSSDKIEDIEVIESNPLKSGIDLNYLKMVTKGKGPQMIRLIELFLSDQANHFSSIHSYYSEKKYEDLTNALHRLKGSLNMFGKTTLLDCIVQGEILVKSEMLDEDRLETVMMKIYQEVPFFLIDLKKELEQIRLLNVEEETARS